MACEKAEDMLVPVRNRMESPYFADTGFHPPDCVKGGNDHVAGVDVSWKGGVGVEDVLPLRPLCLVVNHLAQP